VLEQTYDRWEDIVCDDGSTDGSTDVVETYSERDGRITLLRQANAGVGAALNSAFSASRGEIVCLLDADDYFDPAKLGAVVDKFLSASNVGFVQHGMSVVDPDGNLRRRLPGGVSSEEGWIAERVARRGGRWRSVPASALCFHRDIADLLFPMPVDSLRSMADAYLYMLAPLLTLVGYIDRPLAAYRLHGANLTGSLRLDPDVTSRFLDGFDRVFASVSEKSNERQLPTLVQPEKNHLTYREHRYMEALFDAHSRLPDLLRSAGGLIRRIAADDLYSPARKALGITAFTLAPLLPFAVRSWWINLMLGSGVRRLRM
jgi:glycosyltransferase involved in cell wall biosynthesis